MTRCIVCGKKFKDDADTPGGGDVEVIEGAVKFWDETRGMFVYRHKKCKKADYMTKEKQEKANAEKTPEPENKKKVEPPEIKE